jgi:endonuclease YncB( thermonuclease family)
LTPVALKEYFPFMLFRPHRLLVLLPALILAPVSVRAENIIDGPVVAEILRVIDGDTMLVTARPWPQQSIEVYVRLRGIDTPELRSSCTAGRDAAAAAKQRLEGLAAASPHVKLTRIAADKYFGRIVADVVMADGRDPAKDMLEAGLAAGYSGSGRKHDLCRDG